MSPKVKMQRMQPNLKLERPVKKCPKLNLSVSNLMESDLNLLECLMTDLVLPQSLIDQFPTKYKDRLSTGVTWYKNRTFTVNSWRMLFNRFQASLTKTEKSIITNQENFLKYILRKYEFFNIIKHCGGDMFLVEEAFFKIYKQKVVQNLEKIRHLSDKLPRSAGSIHLLEDFQRKTREKRKCLKVVRHMFEQENVENKAETIKTDTKIMAPEKKRVINEGFDFVSVDLPKLNRDSCVRINNISKEENITALLDELKCNNEREIEEILGDKTDVDNFNRKTNIDFQQICRDIGVISGFCNTNIVTSTVGLVDNEEYNETTSEYSSDIFEDYNESLNQKEEAFPDCFSVSVSDSLFDIDYKTICSDIRLISEMLDEQTKEVEEQPSDINTGVNEDFSMSVMMEETFSEEILNILKFKSQTVSLEELLHSEEMIEIDNLAIAQEVNNQILINNKDSTEYLIFLNETSNDTSALLDEDDDEMLIQCFDEMLNAEEAQENSISSDESNVGDLFETSYEMVDEEISFLVHNNSKLEDDEIPSYSSSSTSENKEGDQTDLKTGESLDNSVNEIPVISFEKTYKHTTEIPNPILHNKSDKTEETRLDENPEELQNPEIKNNFEHLDTISKTDNINELTSAYPMKTFEKPTPTAETKILFCAWMNASHGASNNSENVDELENNADKPIQIKIDYEQICAGISLISGLVKAKSSVLSQSFSTPDEHKFILLEEETDVKHSIKEEEPLLNFNTENTVNFHETALTTEELFLLQQESEEKKEEKLDDLDLQVYEEPAPTASPIPTQVLRNVIFKETDEESEIIQPNKMKIVESFDDIFKSFLKNPIKSPIKETHPKKKTIDNFIKSKEQLIETETQNCNMKGVSQVLDELEQLDTSKMKFKAKLKTTRVKKSSSRKPLISVVKVGEKSVKRFCQFDVKQEVVKKTDLILSASNDIITLDDDDDHDINPKHLSTLVSKPNSTNPASPSVVYVPHDAKILHVPDHTKIVRVKTPPITDNIRNLTVQTLNVPDQTTIMQVKTPSPTIDDKNKNVSVKLPAPSQVNGIQERVVRGARQQPTRTTNVGNMTLGQDKVKQNYSKRIQNNPKSDVSVQQPGYQLASQLPTRQQGATFKSSYQSPPNRQRSSVQSRQSQSPQILSRPEQSSAQPVLPSCIVQQQTRKIKTMNSSAPPLVNTDGLFLTGKRKNQTQDTSQRKSARLVNDNMRRKVVSEPESDGGNEQSELMEFISENILTKAEMRPGGQVSYNYHCNICPYNNRSKWHAENHVESTHGDFDVSYQCDLCAFIAQTRANYYAHGKKKHNIHMEPTY